AEVFPACPYFAPVARRDTKSGGRSKQCRRRLSSSRRKASAKEYASPVGCQGRAAGGHILTVGGNMRIRRQFTVEGRSAYQDIEFRSAASEIRNPDGSIVFRQSDIEVPEAWSQVACDVLAQKYFRKAGVPARLKPVPEEGIPSWLWRKAADGTETTSESTAR